jgi:hypothetical protein
MGAQVSSLLVEFVNVLVKRSLPCFREMGPAYMISKLIKRCAHYALHA